MAATRIPANLPANAVTFRAVVFAADVDDGAKTIIDIIEVDTAGDVRSAARFLRGWVRSRRAMHDAAIANEVLAVAIDAAGENVVHDELSRYLAA